MLESTANWTFVPYKLEKSNLTQSNILNTLLQQRNITTKEEADKFISPKLSDLHSPNNLSMIELASDRIKQAISNKEKILIYGDYDADGVCSTALLLKAMGELGANCDFYIPNRFKEGYGPNKQAFQRAYDNGFQVIITVDTGIASHEEIQFANALGLDVIITDHHDIQESIPDAFAVIHPANSPNYEFTQLAGVGVAFKFAQYLLGYFPHHLLELVAIGTIADLVPLQDENRILALYGLQSLSDTSNEGLIALKKSCRIEEKVTEEDVGFRIGPRLNAVGRLQDADLAVHLLMTEDSDEAESFVKKIEQLNEERQRIVRETVKEAETLIKEVPKKSVIVVAKSNWHEGVLGIVASRLVQKYHCPTIVLTINEKTNEAKGSARSIPAFHLFSSCMEIKHLFNNFGGHSQAAGMTIPLANLDEVTERLNNLAQMLDDDDFKQEIKVNKTLTLNDLTEKHIDDISQLAPFGMGNPKPIFHLQDTPTHTQQIGRMKDHLKMSYNNSGRKIDGIGFGLGDLYRHISPQATTSIVGELGINEWNGFKTVQMIIQDIKIDEWQLFDHRGKKDFDLQPFIQTNANCMVLGKRNKQRDASDIINITYETDLQTISHAVQLFITELPDDLEQLQQIISKVQPEQIHVCYYVENSAYLQSMPSRDEFKWLYIYTIKKGSFNIKQEILKIMRLKNWTKHNVIFMFHVFKQLQFIQVKEGIVTLIHEPVKKDLHDSQVYQNRKKQAEIEKALYYSNYNQLKSIFAQWIGHDAREEVRYGL